MLFFKIILFLAFLFLNSTSIVLHPSCVGDNENGHHLTVRHSQFRLKLDVDNTIEPISDKYFNIWTLESTAQIITSHNFPDRIFKVVGTEIWLLPAGEQTGSFSDAFLDIIPPATFFIEKMFVGSYERFKFRSFGERTKLIRHKNNLLFLEEDDGTDQFKCDSTFDVLNNPFDFCTPIPNILTKEEILTRLIKEWSSIKDNLWDNYPIKISSPIEWCDVTIIKNQTILNFNVNLRIQTDRSSGPSLNGALCNSGPQLDVNSFTNFKILIKESLEAKIKYNGNCIIISTTIIVDDVLENSKQIDLCRYEPNARSFNGDFLVDAKIFVNPYTTNNAKKSLITHEIMHSFLKRSLGCDYSWGHKGTTTSCCPILGIIPTCVNQVILDSAPSLNDPKPIDIMKYYKDSSTETDTLWQFGNISPVDLFNLILSCNVN